MKLQAEYKWLQQYTNSPQFWVEDVLSWDESLNISLSDYSLFTLLTSSFFVKTYILLDVLTRVSLMDVSTMKEGLDLQESLAFYDALMWDLFELTQTLCYSSQFIFYTDNQSFYSVVIYHSPELVLAISDFVSTYCNSSVLAFVASCASKLFSDFTISLVLKTANMLILVCVLVWVWLIFSYVMRLVNWDNTLESYLTRFTLYFYSISKENRLQLESALLTAMLFTILFVWDITSFRHMYQESIEYLNTLLFNIFLFIYVFFLYKNSIHYFSFLEASVSDRRTASVFVQTLKDFSNSFVLVLRFLTLLIRLNIYDTVDDVLDSNYIFTCDFEDDCFYADTFGIFYRALLCNNDLYGDRTLFFENTLDSSFDLFLLYFLVCCKFVSFVFFALEEIGRVLLSFFIVYLIIFEMQSINRSYNEENSILSNRANV